jgi:hypothetical protein
MAGAEQHPVVFRQFFEPDRALALGQRVGGWEDGDELLPSQFDDGTWPLGRSGAHGDVADSEVDCVIEGATVRVLAKRDPHARVALAPAFKGRAQHAERDGGHCCHFELSCLESQRALSIAPRALGVRDGGAGLGQECLAGGGESNPFGQASAVGRRVPSRGS